MPTPTLPRTVPPIRRADRELIRLDTDPRFQVPASGTDQGWFARQMAQYTATLERTLDRMQQRIEQLEGQRGAPEMHAPLSMLGNAITDVADPTLTKLHNVVTVQFMLANALGKNAAGR